MKIKIVTALFAAAFFGISVSNATAQDGGVDFEKQILPVLKAKCFKCHEKEHEDNGKIKKPKGGLRLDGADVIMKGGKENPGETVVAGKPDASWLVKSIALPESDEYAMPPEGKGDRVTAEEQALIKKWIEGGAKFGAWKGES
ncbi:MAG: c-type cytochrome domain-containing protein [Prosthecobacter sp.]|nr:c-type cytochrome domain-containing protein [Prosthecobacter sp.]